jgi:hypothetical protein
MRAACSVRAGCLPCQPCRGLTRVWVCLPHRRTLLPEHPEVLVVENALEDIRFRNNPLVRAACPRDSRMSRAPLHGLGERPCPHATRGVLAALAGAQLALYPLLRRLPSGGHQRPAAGLAVHHRHQAAQLRRRLVQHAGQCGSALRSVYCAPAHVMRTAEPRAARRSLAHTPHASTPALPGQLRPQGRHTARVRSRCSPLSHRTRTLTLQPAVSRAAGVAPLRVLLRRWLKWWCARSRRTA